MPSVRQTLTPLTQLPLFEIQPEFLRSYSHSLEHPGHQHTKVGLHRVDAFNAQLLSGLTLVGPYDIPKIDPSECVPERLIDFSEAMSNRRADQGAWVHFFEHDERFMRVWNRPNQYLERLRRFAGVISPDFSLYRNMPTAQKIEHTYRNQLLGARMQADGIPVIANVRLSGRESIPYALAGAPRESTIAVGLLGCTKDRPNRGQVLDELSVICDELAPKNLVVYGSSAYGILDGVRELGVSVHVFAPDTYHRSRDRRGVA